MKILKFIIACHVFVSLGVNVSLVSCAHEDASVPPNKIIPAQQDDPFGEVGSIIPDAAPLVENGKNDLQALALTLPLFFGGYEETLRWVEEENGSIETQHTWQIVADGAQTPVKVLRLVPRGKTPVIRVFWGPNHMESTRVIADLERTTGGWKVLDKKFQKNASIKDG